MSQERQEQLTSEHLKQWEAHPPSRACRLLDFEKVEVRPGFVPRTFILIVSGTKPYANMTVELRPLTSFQQPEYWGIEVVGCLPGFGLPVVAPYTVSLPLDGVTGRRRRLTRVPPRRARATRGAGQASRGATACRTIRAASRRPLQHAPLQPVPGGAARGAGDRSGRRGPRCRW
jgi:hypothetical protein